VPSAMISSRFVPTSAVPVFAIELGQGPPVLFLHGITASAYIWLPVLERLAPRFRVVAIDQRGHGRSAAAGGVGPSDAAAFGAEGYARDAIDVAAALGAGPVLLAGHSLGARNAIAAAARRPELFAGVIAIEFTPFIDAGIFDALEERVGGGLRAFGGPDEVTSYLAGRYRRLPAEAVARRARYGYAAAPDGGVVPLADAQAMRLTCAGLREDLTGDVRALRVPAVLVRGADSTFVRPEALAATSTLRPDLPAVVVEGADHYVPEERPAEVARIITEFGTTAGSRP
jgi:2-(acetamidomethylene)succinate hydrolase